MLAEDNKVISLEEYRDNYLNKRIPFTGIVKYEDGSSFYYKKGKYHRLDGPAWEWSKGHKNYFINGNEYTKEEYMKHFDVVSNSKEFQDLLKYKELT